MPRFATNRIRQYFEYSSLNNLSTCLISECKAVIRGNHASNLERHVKRLHNECYKKFKEKQSMALLNQSKSINKTPAKSNSSSQMSLTKTFFKTVEVNIDAQIVKQACLELVTVNGRPFKIIDDSGFRKVLDPLLKALCKNGCQLCINAENICEEIHTLADNLRKKIKNEVLGKFLSLKIDIATRIDRAILGVNLQFIKNGKLTLRTIAMKELVQRHTAEYIKRTVVEILEVYQVSLDQIYTITTDNGANMIKSVELLSDEQVKTHSTLFDNENLPSTSNAAISNPCVEQIIESDSSDEDYDPTFLPMLNVEVLIGDLTSFPLNESSHNPILHIVRCAAHTLQLAVDDALKNSSFKEIVSKARKICKILRNPSILVILKKLKRKKPMLDCVTRWHSTCDMLERLLFLKDFCQEMAASNPDLHLEESQWNAFHEIFLF